MPRPETLRRIADENRAKLVAIYRAEHERRQRLRQGFAMYRDRPVEFVQEVLGEHLWSKQKEIIEAVAQHPKVAVASCHGIGKSWVGSRVVTWFCATSPPGDARAVTTAPTAEQVRGVLWQEIHSAHARGRLPGKPSQTEWWIDDRQVAIGRKPSDYNPSAFQGYHAPRLLVLIDEACGVPEALWTAAGSLATTDESRMLAIGNPDDPASHFATICKPGSGWHVIHVSAFDSPNFTQEWVPDRVRKVLTSEFWVEDKRRVWGEQSPLWQSKVLGQFPDVGDDTLIAPGWVRRAIDRFEEEPEGIEIELGCDIARFGSNETVIVKRAGRRATIHKVLRRRDLMEVTGHIVQAIRETGAARVKIDDTGLGGGVTDRLNEMRSAHELGLHPPEIVPVNVGSAPSDHTNRDERGESERFFNLRAELYWHLRMLFENGEIAIEGDDELAGQLCAVKYKMESKGRLKLESKEDMAKRSIPSPDRADALMLAFAPMQPKSLRAWEGML